MTFMVKSYEHVGIRVTDRNASIAFYEKLNHVQFENRSSSWVEMDRDDRRLPKGPDYGFQTGRGLGWREEISLPEHSANEMVNDAGIYINLVFNGVKRPEAKNILQDEPLKYPGMTHAAFIIDDMDDLVRLLNREKIPITDGPVVYSGRRKVLFIRDLDGNVLEFNELLAGGHQ